MFLYPRNHPGLAESLIDLLRTHGAHPEPQLRALLIPPNLWNSNEREVSSGKPAAVLSFENTRDALLSTNVLQRDADQLGLTDSFASHLGSAPASDGLGTWLLHEQRTGTDPCNPDSTHDGSGDLAHALTWFLQLDPLGPWARPSSSSADASPVARLQQETGRILPDRTFSNPSDWSLLVRWSAFLGFAELRPGGRLDPDPTVAIDRVLDNVLTEEMSLTAFLVRLGESLPMYGGHLERSWYGSSTPTSQGVITPSLANTLLRLEHRGRLRLDSGVDEDDVMILEFGRFAPVQGPEGTITPTRRRYARIWPEVAA